MPESCPDQHHGGVTVREASDDPCPAANLLHDALQSVIGPQTGPVFIWKIHVGQGLLHAFLHKLRRLFQLHSAKLFHYQARFRARGLFIFLRVDRLQHGGYFTDMFPRAQIENVAIPMDHAALPFCLREEVPDDFVQAEAFIRNDQPHAFQPAVLQIAQKVAPGLLVLAASLGDAQNLTVSMTSTETFWTSPPQLRFRYTPSTNT